MACACKVNQQIDYLHKKYGNKIPESKESNISQNIKFKFKKGLINLFSLVISPVLFIIIVISTIFGKKVFTLSKILRTNV